MVNRTHLAWIYSVVCLFASLSAFSEPAASQTLNPKSGKAYLSASMIAMQNDPMANPISLWLEKGKEIWSSSGSQTSCQQCHGLLENNKSVATQFPKWSSKFKKLINLEDQILECSKRTSEKFNGLEDSNLLALSAALHQQSVHQSFTLRPDQNSNKAWQSELNAGAQLYTQRIGRMNLACTHCHDQNVGKRMQTDLISPGNPTGFPIFKMSWQGMGSIDRRLRACFSGVQANVPLPGSRELRQLELFLKMRAEGMPIEGPSLRR